MGLCVKQFRYYGEGHEKNYPSTLNQTVLSNNILPGPSNKIKIYTTPGIKFQINDNKSMIIGATGIYELDL
jgi:hypothetical protein